MRRLATSLIPFALLLSTAAAAQPVATLASPDGGLEISFQTVNPDASAAFLRQALEERFQASASGGRERVRIRLPANRREDAKALRVEISGAGCADRPDLDRPARIVPESDRRIDLELQLLRPVTGPGA